MTADFERRLRDAAADASRVAAGIDTEALLEQIEGRRPRTRLRFTLVTAAVLAVVAAGGVAVWQLAAPRPVILEESDPVGPPGASEEPAPGSDASEPAPGTRACSAAGLAPTPPPQPELPAEVAALRDQLARLAVACDLDGLAALTHGSFTYSFGGDGDPAGFWRRAETDRAPDQPAPMESLRRLLDAPFGVVEYVSVGPARYFAWPRLHHLDPAQTPAAELDQAIEEVVATGLYTRQELEDMVSEGGGYFGYRVVIEVPQGTSDARWISFVAGD